MRAEGQAAVERLLARLGKPFWAVFHVDEQKCELGFRVEVTTSQDALRYDLRFWGCPERGLHRIRRFLAQRVAGDADRNALPSLDPPRQAPSARRDQSVLSGAETSIIQMTSRAQARPRTPETTPGRTRRR